MLFQDFCRILVSANLACFCTLLGLCYSTLQSLKGTQKEKYSINTLHDETVGVYLIYITLKTELDALVPFHRITYM